MLVWCQIEPEPEIFADTAHIKADLREINICAVIENHANVPPIR